MIISAFRTDPGSLREQSLPEGMYQGGTELAKEGRRKKGNADLTDTMTNVGSLRRRFTAGRDTNG